MNTTKTPTHSDVINKVLEAGSIVCLMGWAAMGQEYAGGANCLDCPSGADFSNAARVVDRLLIDVCNDLETLKQGVQA